MGILLPDENDLHKPVSTFFYAQTGLIIAHLDKVDYGYINQPVRYQGRTFQPMPELHFSIVRADAPTLLKYVENHPADADDIQDLAMSTDWSFIKLDEFYHSVEKRGIETIIQMIEIPSLHVFLKGLSKLVGQGFILPPTYVTLYALGAAEGIHLPDQISFQEHARDRVNPGEVRLDKDQPAHSGADPSLAR